MSLNTLRTLWIGLWQGSAFGGREVAKDLGLQLVLLTTFSHGINLISRFAPTIVDCNEE